MLMIASGRAFSQDIPRFELTKDGITPIVIPLENMTAPDIYTKAVNWVKTTYKTPKEVLKSEIQNEELRIDAVATNAFFLKVMLTKYYYTIWYSMTIQVKNGKMRLLVTSDKITLANGTRADFGFNDFYTSSGELRSRVKDAKPQIEQEFNSLATSLYQYIKTDKKTTDW